MFRFQAFRDFEDHVPNGAWSLFQCTLEPGTALIHCQVLLPPKCTCYVSIGVVETEHMKFVGPYSVGKSRFLRISVANQHVKVIQTTCCDKQLQQLPLPLQVLQPFDIGNVTFCYVIRIICMQLKPYQSICLRYRRSNNIERYPVKETIIKSVM
jgi:hypothetical protein